MASDAEGNDVKKPGITNIIEFDLTIEELRKVTGTQDKLKQIGEFKKDV